jgi:2-polyprenyl-3-methyl-5-hydroxy-6-metoxy-1,4-benzoquinol methylase
VFKRFIQDGSILELGPAEGFMTNHLAELGLPLTIVEGAGPFCEDLKRRFPQANVVHALFEEFTPEQKFNNIILGHVLEHVENPVDILSRCREWLTENGRILAAVPNARSLHRQAAVILGMLEFEEQLNESDLHHGHRRVYTPETFRRDFLASGLKIEFFGGYWLKPLSNGQIEKDWSPALLNAFMALGERYPDISGEIYIVAKR